MEETAQGIVYCQSCGKPVEASDRFCPKCGQLISLSHPQETDRQRFPGALWLLPIFFGPIGGITASLIANMKYGAKWWGLLLVGFLVPLSAALIWFAFLAAVFARILR